eukprot:10038416-Heterocapsa_arctica.AAC.1
MMSVAPEGTEAGSVYDAEAALLEPLGLAEASGPRGGVTWGHFWITLGQLCDQFGVTLVLFWGALWDRFGDTLAGGLEATGAGSAT